MRKVISIALVLLVAFSVFAGGSGEKKNDQIVIEFWTHEDATRQALEDSYIAEFEEMHPNVTIHATRQASSKIIELVQTAFAAGEGPTIFNLTNDAILSFVSTGNVAPMDYEAAGYEDAADVIDAYIDGMLEPVTYDGEVYGLPLELNNWCIFINKQVFRDAGLDPETDYPKTWEEMVEVSQKLVIRDGDILVRRGYDFRYPYYLETIVPMVEQLGGKLISDDGTEAIIGEDAWIKVLTFMQQWGPNGLNLGAPTYTNARSLFNKNNNDIAMCTTGLYQEARIRTENPEFYESGDWMVVPYPVFEDAVNDVSACHYGQYYMVNANEDPETISMAWEFIAFMLSHGEDYLTQVNLIQPTKELMNSDTYKNMPYSDVFTADLGRAHVLYYGPNANEIQSLLRTAIEGVMLQGITPQDAYTQLKNSVQELIDEEA